MSTPLSPRSTIVQKIYHQCPCSLTFFLGSSSSSIDVTKESDMKEIFDRAIAFLREIHESSGVRGEFSVYILVKRRGEEVDEFNFKPGIVIPDASFCESDGSTTPRSPHFLSSASVFGC